MRALAYRAWHKTYRKMFRVLGWREDDDGQMVVWCKDERDITFRFADTINGIPGLTVLMQATGLQDKHGKDIFEGDIVRHQDISWGTYEEVVKYEQGLWNYSSGIISGSRCQRAHIHWEIIGNIYEQPELIGQKGEV